MSVIREKQQFTLSFDLIDEDGELNLDIEGRAPFTTASVKGKAPIGLTETWATPTGTSTTPNYGAANDTQKESLAFGGTTFTWTASSSFVTTTNTGVVTGDGGTTKTTKLTTGSVNVTIDTTTGQPGSANKALSTSGTWHFQVVLIDGSSEYGSEPISIHVAEKLE